MTNQAEINNLNYLIDPTFTKINRLLVSSFENKNGKTSFLKHYVPSVQIKDFNVLKDRKKCFRHMDRKWPKNIQRNYRNGKKQLLHDW